MSGIRCVCGRSKAYPICDGSHQNTEGWVCASASLSTAFCSAISLTNMCAKLSHHYKGSTDLMAPGSEQPVNSIPRTLVVLLALDDLQLALQWMRACRRRPGDNDSSSCRILCFAVGLSMGVAGALLSKHGLVCDQLHCVDSDDIFQVFNVIVAELDAHWQQQDGKPSGSAVVAVAAADTLSLDGGGRVCRTRVASEVPRLTLPPAFISHSVSDEATLVPVVTYLREHFASNLFLCADSIRVGDDWRQIIEQELRKAPIFMLIFSKATLTSTYCAFEVGVAVGMGKQIYLVSLDGSTPPAFVSNIHMIDIPRLTRTKPWLSVKDALLSSVLECFQEYQQQQAAGSPPAKRRPKEAGAQ